MSKTANPAVTFSPEALQAVIAQAVAIALAAQRDAKPAANGVVNAKSERSLKNEIAVVKAFKKAGFGNVKPHVDVMTFKRWVAAGFRPIEGSKSLKIKNLRLFHKTQCRPITLEEKAALAEQNANAVANFTGNVQKLNPSKVQ